MSSDADDEQEDRPEDRFIRGFPEGSFFQVVGGGPSVCKEVTFAEFFCFGTVARKRGDNMSQQSQQCVIGKFCKSHECYHGQEAEDLRKGVEDLLEEAKSQGLHLNDDLPLSKGEDLLDAYNGLVDGLQHLLDTTDAADSLSFVESDDEDDEDDEDDDDSEPPKA